MRITRLAGCRLAFVAVTTSVREAESTKRWQDDLRYLETEAPRRHPNLFHPLSREQWTEDGEESGWAGR